jgi:hypothetical protein
MATLRKMMGMRILVGIAILLGVVGFLALLWPVMVWIVYPDNDR